MLYLVATPIGNLQDITFRAIEVLKSCDYILCEDTRHSLSLLRHYEIKKPLKSYHKFVEAKKEEEILEDLQQGKTICLISDAGTPGIADPGERLTQKCLELSIPVISIPGACAAIQALTSSGMSTERFQFVGFLPKKMGELKKALTDVLRYPGTTICYESPHRLRDTLELIQQMAPQRILAVARELTKKFEEIIRGTGEEILSQLREEVKGEIVLLISGCRENNSDDWSHLSLEEHVKEVQEEENLTLQEAIKLVAKLRKIPRRELYAHIHEIPKKLK